MNHLYSKEGLWYIWVYLLETDDCKAVDYVCTISIRSADGEEELNCRCRPLSLDLTKENIAEPGRGLVFTDTTARWAASPSHLSILPPTKSDVVKWCKTVNLQLPAI